LINVFIIHLLCLKWRICKKIYLKKLHFYTQFMGPLDVMPEAITSSA
jgi:hypothetical protein